MANFETIIRRYSKPMNPVGSTIAASITLKEPVRGVLFDVYGTLFISRAGDIGAAKKEASRNIDEISDLCNRYGIPMTAATVIDKFFECIEMSRNEAEKAGIDYPEVVIEEIWRSVLGMEDLFTVQTFALEYEMIVNPVWPMPHVQELLSACKKREIPMGIISNAQFYTPYLFSALLGHTLSDLGFQKDLLFFSYQQGYGKPSLQPFHEAASILKKGGVEEINVLFVGNDMLKDVAPASEIGFQTALFAGDGRSLNLRKEDRRCKNIHPDMVVTDLVQIAECLAGEGR